VTGGRWILGPALVGSVACGGGTGLWTLDAVAEEALAPVRACTSIRDAEARLACFDREVARLAKPLFSGRHSVRTDAFTIARPMRLRYQSDGAIFVLYLRSDDDRVIQNLHLGGGGEDSYVIRTPGIYHLQVNGSETWRIWLEEP